MHGLLIIPMLTRLALELSIRQGSRETSMTDDTILSHAEALAEIKRLRAEVQRLRDAIIELELGNAVTRGSLAIPTPGDDQPATYTHDVPPNAPR